MKNLLLLLLLANILYFLYSAIRGDEEPRGEVIVDESQLGPQLTIAESAELPDGVDVEAPDEASAEDSAVVDATIEETADVTDAETVTESTDEPAVMEEDDTSPPVIELQAVVGKSCVSVGDFDEREDADRAHLQMRGDGLAARIRSTLGMRSIGHWVQIKNIASLAEANTMLETLKANGLGESYIIQTEDEGIKISIGLFGEASGAERVELQVTSLGLPAVIAPRMSEGTVYFIDAVLPPGRGAGELIERYGESRVLLRSAATCPEDG